MMRCHRRYFDTDVLETPIVTATIYDFGSHLSQKEAESTWSRTAEIERFVHSGIRSLSALLGIVARPSIESLIEQIVQLRSEAAEDADEASTPPDTEAFAGFCEFLSKGAPANLRPPVLMFGQDGNVTAVWQNKLGRLTLVFASGHLAALLLYRRAVGTGVPSMLRLSGSVDDVIDHIGKLGLLGWIEN
jgi:hypothetical protein